MPIIRLVFSLKNNTCTQRVYQSVETFTYQEGEVIRRALEELQTARIVQLEVDYEF